MQPERATAWAPAAAVAVVVTIALAFASYVLLETGLRRSTPTLQDAALTGARAVGQTVAGQLSNALRLGIPLNELPGIEPYLERVAESSPQVAGLALLDETGKRVATSQQEVEGVTFPVSGGGADATLVVAPESPLIDESIQRTRIALGIASLLAGAVAAGIVFSFLAFHRGTLRRRLVDGMEKVAGGDFGPSVPSEGNGPIAEAARALRAGTERVKAARRHLTEAVATLRAIDFDGSLGRQVDAISSPVEHRYAFADADDDPSLGNGRRGGSAVWRLVLFLGLYGIALPYVASFAIDREADAVPLAWAPVVPLLIELFAAVLGALIGRTSFGRSGAALALGSILLAASLIATYWCRTYELFLLLRALAGLAGGLTAAAFLFHRRIDVAPRDVAALLLFAALVVAPMIAGLYAEAIGRRSGFLVLGLAVLLAMPFVVLGGSIKAMHSRPAHLPFNRADMLLGLATMPAAALVLHMLPAGIVPGSYLSGTGAAAIAAAFALVAPRASRWVYGVVLLAAAVMFAFPSSGLLTSTFLPCIALGLGFGGILRSTIVDTARPWTALAFGAGAGLLLSGAISAASAPFAVLVAAAAIAILAIDLAQKRPVAARTA